MSVCSACEQFFFVRSVRRYVSIGSSNYYYTLTKIHLVNPVESVDNLLIESLMFIFQDVTETSWYKKHFASSSCLEIETKHNVEVKHLQYFTLHCQCTCLNLNRISYTALDSVG